MLYPNIKSALDSLSHITAELEIIYTENGGEMTAETDALEAEKAAIADLLEGEGNDSLGRWLKAKEDEKAMYKAEKAMADRKMKAADKTIDFIKQTVGDVLRATEREKVKGSFYSFSQFVSTKTGVDTEALDARYLDDVRKAAHAAGLPENIDVALKTTATKLQESEDTAAFTIVEKTPSCKYTKPKAAKDE
jgi:hypothetical protein